ncbi:hypothetical protein ALISP_1922 [Alicycliphilus sp. B1]|nr:hypothetical protein ALISP_1922 [Alicycliphilus sp. B1]
MHVPFLAAQQGQFGEQRVVGAEQRRLEHARQRQVVRGRDQRVQQRDEVLHFGSLGQVGLLGLHAGDVQGAQRLFHARQAFALSRQHHDLAGGQAGGQLRRHPLRGLGALGHAQGFLGLVARLVQAVAPGERVGRAAPPDPRVRPGDRRQAQQPARVLRFGRVRAKAFVFLLRLRGLHGSVDHADHALRIAPGVVAGQQVAAERLAHEGLRGLEHLGLCAAKAVDALLGVAHDEHAGRVLPPARARIARQPGVQRLPLQRVGVLELVHEQVAHARVQPLLHPAGEHGVGQQRERGALHVVHVHPAMLALDGPEAFDQAARQARHALLVQPCGVLAAGVAQRLRLVLRDGDGLGARFAEGARRALAVLGEQRGQHALPVAGLQGRHQLLSLGREARRQGHERARRVFEHGPPGGAAQQPVARVLHAGQAFIDLAERRHRRIDDARLVRQQELHALVQRRLQRLVRLRAAMHGDDGLVVGAQRVVAGHGLQEWPPNLGLGLRVVFEQLVVRGQAPLLQQRQRGRGKQRGKPAVEGADLQRAAAGQQLLVQIS